MQIAYDGVGGAMYLLFGRCVFASLRQADFDLSFTVFMDINAARLLARASGLL